MSVPDKRAYGIKDYEGENTYDIIDQGDLMQNQLFFDQYREYDHSKAKQTVTHLIVHDKEQVFSYDIIHNENEPVTKSKASEYLGDRGVALFKYVISLCLSLLFLLSSLVFGLLIF